MLAEVGYDRLTMDAVATAAKASKATLYRRWNGKADARHRRAARPEGRRTVVPDTGTPARRPARGLLRHRRPHRPQRRGDVRQRADRDQPRRRSSPPRSATTFIGPKAAVGRAIFERARDRGELREDVDLDLLAPALAGIVLHRVFLLGAAARPGRSSRRVIDQIILPAALAPHA